MNIHQYKVGDKATVLIDLPLYADLWAGDIVTIRRVIPQPGRGYDSYEVEEGGWSLHYKVIEPIGISLENK